MNSKSAKINKFYYMVSIKGDKRDKKDHFSETLYMRKRFFVFWRFLSLLSILLLFSFIFYIFYQY